MSEPVGTFCVTSAEGGRRLRRPKASQLLTVYLRPYMQGMHCNGEAVRNRNPVLQSLHTHRM